MVFAVCWMSVVWRWFLCQTWQRWARARRVYSSVISGFVFPQAIRLFGEEPRQDGAHRQMAHIVVWRISDT